MCVRILDFTKHRGGRVTVSNLRRGVNAYHYGDTYELAIQKLQKLGAITVEKEPGTRRLWLTVLAIPKCFQATRGKPKGRQHAPRSRGRTTWFKARAQRELAKQFALLIADNIREAQRFIATALTKWGAV
jgi:hypothetical protein